MIGTLVISISRQNVVYFDQRLGDATLQTLVEWFIFNIFLTEKLKEEKSKKFAAKFWKMVWRPSCFWSIRKPDIFVPLLNGLNHLKSDLRNVQISNESGFWMLRFRIPTVFRPAFGVCSIQMLVKIYNSKTTKNKRRNV